MTALRDALTAGEADTPAGVDLPAIRSRAHRIRRRRVAATAGTAAALAALATAVPVLALRPDGAPTAAAPPALACPERIFTTGTPTGSGTLLPGPPTGALVCTYGGEPGKPLTGVLRLSPTETDRLAARLEATPAAPDGDLPCTADLGRTYALQFVDRDRATTIRVEDYGCHTVTNGSVTRLAGAEQSYLDDLGDRASATSACPETLTDPAAVLAAPAGPTLLPPDTRRLLLCAYLGGGVRSARGPAPDFDALVEDPDRYVAGLNSAGPAACDAAAGDPRLLVAAVTPSGVKQVVARPGNCPSVTDGTRTLAGGPLVQDLYDLTQR